MPALGSWLTPFTAEARRVEEEVPMPFLDSSPLSSVSWRKNEFKLCSASVSAAAATRTSRRGARRSPPRRSPPPQKSRQESAGRREAVFPCCQASGGGRSAIPRDFFRPCAEETRLGFGVAAGPIVPARRRGDIEARL